MGRNGSGKSSLLWALQGAGRRDGGRGPGRRHRPRRGYPADRARALVGLVPQTAADLLYLETVDDECAAADDQAGAAARHLPGAARPARARRRRAAGTRATSPRASGSRSCWRSC